MADRAWQLGCYLHAFLWVSQDWLMLWGIGLGASAALTLSTCGEPVSVRKLEVLHQQPGSTCSLAAAGFLHNCVSSLWWCCEQEPEQAAYQPRWLLLLLFAKCFG